VFSSEIRDVLASAPTVSRFLPLLIQAHRTSDSQKPFSEIIAFFLKSSSSSTNTIVGDFVCDYVERNNCETEVRVILALLTSVRSSYPICPRRLIAAFDRAMGIVNAMHAPVFKSIVTDVIFWESWVDIVQESPNLRRALSALRISTRPSDLPPALRTIINPSSDSDSPMELGAIFSLDDFSDSFAAVMFGDDPGAISALSELTIALLGPADPEFVDFIRHSVVEPRPTVSKFPENTWAHSIVSLFPCAIERLAAGFCPKAYFDVLEALFFVAPRSVSLLMPDFGNLYKPESPIANCFLPIIHHVCVFDGIDVLPVALVEKLMATKIASAEAFQMLFLLREKATGSVLSGACVDATFRRHFDSDSLLLLKMVTNGFTPGPFCAPVKPPDNLALALAVELWEGAPTEREGLRRLIRRIMRYAIPSDMFRLAPSARKATLLVGKVR
jgi:hypothetical protein